MVYNVLTEKKIWEAYPEFTRRTAFKKIPAEVANFSLDDMDKLIKFAVVFIDPSSKFADERDFELRKNLCLEHLGADPGDRFFEEVEEDTRFWHMIMFEYFKMCHSLEYELWFSSWYSLKIQYAKLRDTSMKETDRSKIQDAIQQQTYDLIRLENQLFPDERTKQVVSRIATEDSIAGYAELFAQEITQ